MKEVSEPVRHRRAGRRSIYCTPAERAEIGARAREAGMAFSKFMVACALCDDKDEDAGPCLVLSEKEQKELHRRVELLDRCNEALLTRVPGMEMSMLGALAFLVEQSRRRSSEAGGEQSE